MLLQGAFDQYSPIRLHGRSKNWLYLGGRFHTCSAVLYVHVVVVVKKKKEKKKGVLLKEKDRAGELQYFHLFVSSKVPLLLYRAAGWYLPVQHPIMKNILQFILLSSTESCTLQLVEGAETLKILAEHAPLHSISAVFSSVYTHAARSRHRRQKHAQVVFNS
eukprot:SAG31_NODE_1363_length_8627_cov_5.967402_6_plen_162_part_00